MYSKKQRIAAICGIILLVSLYIFTLIAAIFNFDGTGNLFKACIFSTIAIPILIWIYTWVYGVLTKDNPTDIPENQQLPSDSKSQP